MTDSPDVVGKSGLAGGEAGAKARSYSFHELMELCRRRRRFLLGTVAGLLLLCLLYCLIAPNQYEARAEIALRIQSTSSLTVDAVETLAPASILSTPLQLETLVNVLRSERLEWRVITSLKLYEARGFVRNFDRRFPGFDIQKPSAEAEAYLLESFSKRLRVTTLRRRRTHLCWTRQRRGQVRRQIRRWITIRNWRLETLCW